MAYTFLKGNIKQQMLPFLLVKSSALNKDGNGYENSSPLYFTFRNNNKETSSGKGILNFYPKTMKDYFNKDISYKLIYKYNKDNRIKPKQPITFDSICDNIPAILIREYLPDTALEQGINFFVSLIKEVMSMFGDKGMASDIKKASEADNSVKSGLEQTDSIFKKLWNVTWFVMKYVVDGLPKTATKDYTTFKCSFAKSPYYNLILQFPHMIYYRLQSCTTTNIYEVPYIKQDKRLYSSDGAAGWNADENSGWRFSPKSIQNLPIFGPMLGKMFGNIGISWTPWWDAMSGNTTPEPLIDITFDLFNDTNDAALYNFIFINTLIPNNKWLQYGLFLHSSHIYDIKLEGYNRLFACTGQFDVTYDGVLRDPPPNWLTAGGPLQKYLNSKIDQTAFFTAVKNDKTIKIPDIYKVKMTFNSLLPSNFNNYLYTMVANDNHIDTYKNKTRDDSKLTKAMTDAFTGLLIGAKDAFADGQGYVPDDLKL